jgi:hypothetical protein
MRIPSGFPVLRGKGKAVIPSIVFWLYLANAVLLILHEMDSAYWKEWNLFGLPGGIGGFLLIHAPLYAVLLYGVIPVWRGDGAGAVLSLVVGTAGLAAFFLHRYFLWKGRPEFSTAPSLRLLYLLLLVSAVQIAATVVWICSG